MISDWRKGFGSLVGVGKKVYIHIAVLIMVSYFNLKQLQLKMQCGSIFLNISILNLFQLYQ